MARKLTRDQTAELEQLRVACLAILDYFTPRSNLGELAREFRGAVQDAYAHQNLRGLRHLRRDFQEWLTDLPAEETQELQRSLALLEERNPSDVLEDVIGRRRIDSEDEYRVVLARVEEIYADPIDQAEVTRLNEMLAEYDQRT